MKKILITGVAGLIGRLAWKQLSRYPEKYDMYGMDRTLERSNQAGPYFRDDNIPPEKAAQINNFTVKSFSAEMHLPLNAK